MNRCWLLAVGFALVLPAAASDDVLIFSDQLNNGWQNWGWVPNYFTNNPVQSGTNAIGIAPSAGNQALHLEHDAMDTALYTNLILWINGGIGGGQSVQLGAYVNGVVQPKVAIGINGKLPTNMWQQVTVSLAALGCANRTNFNGIGIWSSGTNVQSNFFVDSISLVAAPPPALVHVGVNAAQTRRTVDARLFGVNTAAWDGNLDSTSTVAVLNEVNSQVLRWPGGSWGDLYHWTNEPWMTGATSARNWGAFSTNFIHVATNARTQAFIICNYGSSTTNEAVFGVRMFNVTNHCGFKYWEIGNENYGNWEEDINTNPAYFGQQVAHDPWTYAMRFKDYYTAMKAVDPTIKIGAVACPDAVSYANNKNHPAVDPVTGLTNYGWTAVMLNTFRTNGATPDFLIEHKYAPSDGDTYNLLWPRTWISDTANLRQLLNDYLGGSVATNVELVCTEFGPQGDKQWISLVGGLYYADNVGQCLQTEMNALLWWDLRNGVNAVTNSDNALYGWRTNSAGYFITDEGCIQDTAEPTNRMPSFYGMKLMQYFARGGDTVVAVTNDYQLLGTYAVKRTNGSLTLLVINKSSSSNLAAAINLTGYVPATNAIVYSYGIPQDNAVRTGIGSTDIFQTNFTGAGVNFTNTFAPYSATVLVFVPTPTPALLPMVAPAGRLVFQLQGQPGARYALLKSTNLLTGWQPASTNTLSGTTQNFTNPVSGSQQFWKAQWLP